VGFEVAKTPRVSDEVDGFCCAPDEDDFGRVFGVYEFGYGFATVFIQVCGFDAECMHGTVDVGVVLLVVICYSFDDLSWFLCGGSIIKID